MRKECRSCEDTPPQRKEMRLRGQGGSRNGGGVRGRNGQKSWLSLCGEAFLPGEDDPEEVN